MGKHHQHDSWDATATSSNMGYDPHEFYTSSSDKKGHQQQFRVNVPPSLGSEIAQLVQSQRIPAYRTAQDVIRDALIHRLQWLRDHGHPISRDMQHELDLQMAKVKAQTKLQRVQEAEEYLDTIQEVFASLVGPDSRDDLRRELVEASLYVESLPRGFQHKAEAIIEKYKAYL